MVWTLDNILHTLGTLGIAVVGHLYSRYTSLRRRLDSTEKDIIEIRTHLDLPRQWKGERD